MAEKVILAISSLLVLCGCFVFVSATVGFLRFPDFYTRMHSTGKGDTLGILLVLLGLALFSLSEDRSFMGIVKAGKMMMIVVFWFVASPTATHALLRSAFKSGIKPYTKDGVLIVDKGKGPDSCSQ